MYQYENNWLTHNMLRLQSAKKSLIFPDHSNIHARKIKLFINKLASLGDLATVIQTKENAI